MDATLATIEEKRFIVRPVRWTRCFFGPYATEDRAKEALYRLMSYQNTKGRNFNRGDLVVEEYHG